MQFLLQKQILRIKWSGSTKGFAEAKKHHITRRIYGTTWITTTFSMANREVTYMEGFWKLFTYISGYNDVAAKIPMTVPVLTQVRSDLHFEE